MVLVDLITPLVIPFVILAVGWALYSTEELAKLLDEPFGRAADRGRSGGGSSSTGGSSVGTSSGDGSGGNELVSGLGGAVSGAVRRVRAEVRGQKGAPEAVPVEAYCDRIVSELQQQVAITQLLQRRQVEVPLS